MAAINKTQRDAKFVLDIPTIKRKQDLVLDSEFEIPTPSPQTQTIHCDIISELVEELRIKEIIKNELYKTDFYIDNTSSTNQSTQTVHLNSIEDQVREQRTKALVQVVQILGRVPIF